MNITVAGERKEYAAGTTVAELIVAENVETPEYVTVSVNNQFITKEQIPVTELQEGDVIEFLYFMGGGATDRFESSL